MTTTRAIIALEPLVPGTPNFKLGNLTLRELRDDEVLVRIVASGVCHTDITIGSVPKGRWKYPKVLGHEGAGVVLQTGKSVKTAKKDARVLLSFSFCSECHTCKSGHPGYCVKFNLINVVDGDGVFTTADSSAEECAGQFFGQSSFSNLAIVKEKSVVDVSEIVHNEEELKLFSPMGCGFQTGAGTVTKLANAMPTDTVVIMGLGGVGLSSIMAAKIQGCSTIIGVDRVKSRLDLAKELGATHVIDTSDPNFDLLAKIHELTNQVGASIVIDTTGVVSLIRNAWDFTAYKGQLIILGIPPPDGVLEIKLGPFLSTGKTLTSSIEGDVIPSEYIPQMIQWYREGKFPIEKLIQYYPAEKFQQAIDDMHSGVSIKPVLIW